MYHKHYLICLQMIKVSLALLLGSSFARLRGSKVVSIFLLNTLLISFSLDSTLAMNIPGHLQKREAEHSGEAFPFVLRDFDRGLEREQRPDHERPLISHKGINPRDYDVSESREVFHRRFHESNEDTEENSEMPLGSLLRAVEKVIKESGLVLGLGEHFVQDILEGNPNAPSTGDLLNAAMRVANLPIFTFLKYALDALRQDINNAVPRYAPGFIEKEYRVPRVL